jgi:hypothetical protein
VQWAAVLEVIRRLLPFLERKVAKTDPDVLPTLRRVEHDCDRIVEILTLIQKEQSEIIRTQYAIAAKLDEG